MRLIQSADAGILLFIQNHLRFGPLDGFMSVLSYMGDAGAVWIFICLLLMLTKKYRKAGLCALLCMAAGFVLGDLVLKLVVQRPRPFLTLPELTALVRPPKDYSFPSGHACSGFAASAALFICLGRRGAVSFALAVLIAFSRVYVGVHYPGDVLCGALLGAGVSVLLCGTALRKLTGRGKKRGGPVRAP